MSLTERLLLAMSRRTNSHGPSDRAAPAEAHPLRRLQTAFPGFGELIRGRIVVDFGCGEGTEAVAMAVSGAARVLAVDIQEGLLEVGRHLAVAEGVDGKVTFGPSVPVELLGSVDVVVSKNSMEHFAAPVETLSVMAGCLRRGGCLLVTFAPPWYSPYGAHMHFFTKVPWVHLLFSERTVMNVRRRYRSDGALHYEDVEGGLNRMSLARFERLVEGSGLRVESLTYTCVKSLPLAAHVPLLRELLVNQVDCMLRRP